MVSFNNRLVAAAAFGTLSAALVAIAGPANAADPTKNETVAEAPAANDANPAAKPRVKKYCIVQTVTGSMLPTKECKTKEAWAREQVVITAK